MRGKPKFKRRENSPDSKYHSPIVAKFINQVMRRGKKSTAQKIVYQAFEKAEKKLEKPALDIFENALVNVGPALEVRSRRIGGANYQVPMEVKKDRRLTLAMRWLVESARDKQGKNMTEFLAQELIEAYQNTGNAVKKKQDMMKLAEINRAFAHYARY